MIQTGDGDSSSELRLLRDMLRIRRFEEQCIRLTDEIPASFHVSIGQEAAAVGACSVLTKDDYVFTTHRNHAHILAKGGDPSRLLAEITARVDGYCGGRSGSFHAVAPEVGIIHTSAIVGGCLPVAAGASFSAKLQHSQRATVVFFGDGAMEEGVFYETLNLAQLWALPIIFFLENNGRAPFNPVSVTRSTAATDASIGHSARELVDVARAFQMPTLVLDGKDVMGVARAMRNLVARLRLGEGPFFVESRTPRWPGNEFAIPRLIGGATDVAWTWQPEDAPADIRDWLRACDPVLMFCRQLLLVEKLNRQSLLDLDSEVHEEMVSAAQFALVSPSPSPEAALDHTYA